MWKFFPSYHLYLKMILTRCFICKCDCFIISCFLNCSRLSCNGPRPCRRRCVQRLITHSSLSSWQHGTSIHTLSYLCTYGSYLIMILVFWNGTFRLAWNSLCSWPWTHDLPAEPSECWDLWCKPLCPAQFDTFWDVKIAPFLMTVVCLSRLEATESTSCGRCGRLLLALSRVPDFPGIGWRRAMLLSLLVLGLLVLGGQHFSCLLALRTTSAQPGFCFPHPCSFLVLWCLLSLVGFFVPS